VEASHRATISAERVEEMGNKIWQQGAAMLAVSALAVLSGCGGNSTPVGVTINTPTAAIPLGTQFQFQATVTGSSTTTVTWQICLPPTPTNVQPTTCSPAAVGQTQLPSGYGTITTGQNNAAGGLYTAPSVIPSVNPFLVVATSTVDTTAFGSAMVTLRTGAEVHITPSTATIAAGDNFQFTANVTGTTNTNVTWQVGAVAGGTAADGYICPSSQIMVPCTAGEYFAPASGAAGSATITAVSAFDPSVSGTATVTIASSDAPTLTSLTPNTVGEGSRQQDVYLAGTNFNSNDVVMVGNPPVAVPTIFITASSLRATIPAGPLSVAGLVRLVVQAQNGDVSGSLAGPQGLTVVPSRPAVVAVTPDTLVSGGTSLGVNLVGGYFSSQTTVQCGGASAPASLTSGQQLTVTVPAACIPSPGLYPIVVRNNDVVTPNPGMSAINIAVEPGPGDIATGVASSFGVGASPQAIAIDPSLNVAVVANTGDNTVSIINLATNTQVAGSPVPVGHAPTSVAIDDQITTSIGTLGDHIAAVTNSLDNTVSVIDLTTLAVTTLALPNPNTPPNPQPVPYAIGINPLTHRGLVVFQSTNAAVVLDFSGGVGSVKQTVSGTVASIGTGLNPQVAIDPKLNWAISTPGGAGSISIVDLGHNPGVGANSTDLARSPVLIGNVLVSISMRGIGINTETHQALLADPNGPIDTPSPEPSLSTFSLLNGGVSTTSFTLPGGGTFSPTGLVATAVNPLANIGIAVNGAANNAYVVDMQNAVVLQTIAGFNSPQAVAVNPATNTAYVVNQGNNSVSVVPLATTTPNPLQIVESSPSITYAQNPAAGITLSIIGNGFTSTSQVVLDGTALPLSAVNLINSRQITAAIPAASLATARRYVVYVQNGTAISNVTGLTVIQPVTVGSTPVGVAVDSNLDQAVVTNSGSGTISLVNLLTGTLVTPQSPSFFNTGTSPYGVAILGRTGQAVVANNGSNDVTVLDEKGLNGVFNTPITLPIEGGTQPIGVAINSDSGLAAVTNTIPPGPGGNPPANEGGLGTFIVAGATTATDVANGSPIDYLPLAVAIDPAPNNDPSQNIGAVTIGSQTSAIDLLVLPGGAVPIPPVSSLQLPTGVIFDAANQDFLAVDSLLNDLLIVDPLTGQVQGTIFTGINPTSLDYNFNSSTVVTSNAASTTLSILDYVCPPNPNGATSCPTPQVRDVIDVGGTNPSSEVIGPNAVAIDSRLNLAVQVDQTNNRVLLVPLPQ
jgi:DNA-binding beta-propeller fold protein YncE